MSENPPQKDQLCYGISLKGYSSDMIRKKARVDLSLLLELYKAFPDKAHFFNAYFTKLAGTTELRKQIEAGNTEAEIRKSWESGLNNFKTIRGKYLLYQ